MNDQPTPEEARRYQREAMDRMAERDQPKPGPEDEARARITAGILTTCPTVSHLSTPAMGEEFTPILLKAFAQVRVEEREKLATFRTVWHDGIQGLEQVAVADREQRIAELEKAAGICECGEPVAITGALECPLPHGSRLRPLIDALKADLARVTKERDEAYGTCERCLGAKDVMDLRKRAEQAEKELAEARATNTDLNRRVSRSECALMAHPHTTRVQKSKLANGIFSMQEAQLKDLREELSQAKAAIREVLHNDEGAGAYEDLPVELRARLRAIAGSQE